MPREPALRYTAPDHLAPSRAALLPARPNAKDRKAADTRPVSYLSLLNGELQRHSTWAECESRVKGRPAKFKKVRSEEEATDARKSWGLE